MKKLSSDMKAALRSALISENFNHTGNTLRALKSRGFIDSSGCLTKDGWRQAVLQSELSIQCDNLDIPFREMKNITYKGNPERVAWLHLKGEGYQGSYCEAGAVLILIRAAALDVLTYLNTFDSRKDACTRFTEAQLKIHEDRIPEIAVAIEQASREDVLKNFQEIYRSPIVRESYPDLTENSICSLFDAISSVRLRSIAEAIAEDPYQYRAGWPDLTLTKGGNMLWAEVKTTDKLHMSQIITISRMKPLLPGELCVLHLT